MPRASTYARSKVIAKHGDCCSVCRKGPLLGRALHLGMMPDVHVEPRPMCLACVRIAESEDFENALISRLRSLARAYDALWNMAYMRDNAMPIPEPKAYRDSIMLEVQYCMRNGQVPS